MMIYAKKHITDEPNAAATSQHDGSKIAKFRLLLQHSNKSADSKTQPISNPGHRKQTIIPVTAMVEQRQDDIDN